MKHNNPFAEEPEFYGLAGSLSRSPEGPRWSLRLEPAAVAWCAVLADALFLMAVTAGLVP